jgi:single-strand DNA-binding protein
MAERSYNKVIILGRLGQDPEMRYTTSGKAVTTLNVATSRQWTNAEGVAQEKTTWLRVEMWSKLAEIANEWLKKGARVLIDGRLEIDKVGDGDTAKFYTKIVAEQMVMVGNGHGEGVPHDGDVTQEGDIDFSS